MKPYQPSTEEIISELVNRMASLEQRLNRLDVRPTSKEQMEEDTFSTWADEQNRLFLQEAAARDRLNPVISQGDYIDDKDAQRQQQQQEMVEDALKRNREEAAKAEAQSLISRGLYYYSQ
jgi:hypothetical protein